ARHLLVDLDPAELAVAVEVGRGETLLEALLHAGPALLHLLRVPRADLAADQVAVAVRVDRVELLEHPVAALAAALAGGLDLRLRQAAVVVRVQAGRILEVAEVATAVAAAAVAHAVAVAVARTLAGIEAAVAVAVELVETRRQARELRRFGAIDHAVAVGVEGGLGPALRGVRRLRGAGAGGGHQGDRKRGEQGPVLHVRVPRGLRLQRRRAPVNAPAAARVDPRPVRFSGQTPARPRRLRPRRSMLAPATREAGHLRLFHTGDHPCGYWPGRVARDLVFDPHDERLAGFYPQALEWGFRRSGDIVYRPHCVGCRACVAVRIPVDGFRPDRSQRRCLQRNHAVEARVLPAERNAERLALYRRYLCTRHPGGGMDDHGAHEFDQFLVGSWANTRFLELREDGRLLAVAVTDIDERAMSAVYTFYDPDQSARGLG